MIKGTSKNSPVSGILTINNKGFGFLRQKSSSFFESENDPFVSPESIRRYALRAGTVIEGESGEGKEGKPALKSIFTLNGLPPDKARHLPKFHELTTVSPDQRLHLETQNGPLSMRIIDLLSPIGKGSRTLIVSPPKAGKTTLIKEIVNAVAMNHPEVHI